jgi:hypothetical protein
VLLAAKAAWIALDDRVAVPADAPVEGCAVGAEKMIVERGDDEATFDQLAHYPIDLGFQPVPHGQSAWRRPAQSFIAIQPPRAKAALMATSSTLT